MKTINKIGIALLLVAMLVGLSACNVETKQSYDGLYMSGTSGYYISDGYIYTAYSTGSNYYYNTDTKRIDTTVTVIGDTLYVNGVATNYKRVKATPSAI